MTDASSNCRRACNIRVFLCCCLVPLALSSAGGGLLAQETIAPGDPSTASDRLFTSTDVLLAGVVVGSFLLIPPLEGLDTGLNGALTDETLNRNTATRYGGRLVGTLQGGIALTGGIFLIGTVSGSSSLQRAGLHSLEALLVAEFASQMLKIAVGRNRPSVNSSSDHFDPLAFDADRHSFPSGHTSKVFAIATTLSHELKEEAPWIPFVAYPLATWTGVTRVLDQKHWLTDVVAGAALGILSARLVERLNHRGAGGDRSFSWTVMPGTDGGVAFAATIATG